jgi:hypothetical protein
MNSLAMTTIEAVVDNLYYLANRIVVDLVKCSLSRAKTTLCMRRFDEETIEKNTPIALTEGISNAAQPNLL